LQAGRTARSTPPTAFHPDKSTAEAIGDWHYWVAQVLSFQNIPKVLSMIEVDPVPITLQVVVDQRADNPSAVLGLPIELFLGTGGIPVLVVVWRGCLRGHSQIAPNHYK
jgi:hypothetical protein